MAPRIRHRQRFGAENAAGGAGSPQAWDDDHELSGSYGVDEIEGLHEVLAGARQRVDISTKLLTASFRDNGAGNLGWYVGSVGAPDGAQIEAITVSKADGSVGIGTSAPSTALDIASAGAIDVYARLRNGAGALFDVGVSASGTNYLYGRSNAPMVIGTNNADRMAILSTGQVGIGTNSPGAKLHVRGGDLQVERNIGVDGAMFFGAGGTEYIFGSTAIHEIQIGSNGAARLYVGVTGTFVDGFIAPRSDNAYPCGGPGNGWSVVYARTGTISTSDGRSKVTPDGEDITEATGWAVARPSEAELNVARRLAAALGWYKFKDAVAAKGLAGARRHFGLTVQFALDVCADNGVDPWALGIFCRDEVTRKVKVTRVETVQATDPVEQNYFEIEIRAGIPVLVRKTRIEQVLREKMVAVVDEAGEAVIQDGKPLLHPVPVMIEEDRDEWVDEPAGYILGFRYDELTLFLLHGVVAA